MAFLIKCSFNKVWRRFISVIPALRKLEQADYHKYEASLVYIVSSSSAWGRELRLCAIKQKQKASLRVAKTTHWLNVPMLVGNLSNNLASKEEDLPGYLKLRNAPKNVYHLLNLKTGR